MADLRSWLEAVAEGDVAPTEPVSSKRKAGKPSIFDGPSIGSMRRRAPRSGEKRTRTTRRQPKAAVALSPRFQRAMNNHTGGFTK